MYMCKWWVCMRLYVQLCLTRCVTVCLSGADKITPEELVNIHHADSLFIAHNVSMFVAVQNDKSTPLHLACTQGATEVVKLMLSSFGQVGDIINLTDGANQTPLHRWAPPTLGFSLYWNYWTDIVYNCQCKWLWRLSVILSTGFTKRWNANLLHYSLVSVTQLAIWLDIIHSDFIAELWAYHLRFKAAVCRNFDSCGAQFHCLLHWSWLWCHPAPSSN